MNLRMFFVLVAITVIFSSCLVQHPKYASVENTFKVVPGMTEEQVQDSLGVEPYNIHELTETGEKTLAYKYRVNEIKRVPVIMKKNTGYTTPGNYKELLVTYNPEGIVTKVATCNDCDNVKEKEHRIDFATILTAITVTVPSVLVYLNLR